MRDIGNTDSNRIMRRGIPFGPEVKPEESEETLEGRGLLFACYQTSIKKGFRFHQQCEFFFLIIVSSS
jgi:deferrochelatase/peroxidase EfeB